jgi:chromosome segregation ATPase
VADVDKTPAEVEEDVAAADTATLEQTLADYKAAIAAKKDEIKGLEDDLESQFGKTLGDLEAFAAGDTSKGQEMADDAAALEARVEGLQADLENLRDKMKIYKDELASR